MENTIKTLSIPYSELYHQLVTLIPNNCVKNVLVTSAVKISDDSETNDKLVITYDTKNLNIPESTSDEDIFLWYLIKPLYKLAHKPHQSTTNYFEIVQHEQFVFYDYKIVENTLIIPIDFIGNYGKKTLITVYENNPIRLSIQKLKELNTVILYYISSNGVVKYYPLKQSFSASVYYLNNIKVTPYLDKKRDIDNKYVIPVYAKTIHFHTYLKEAIRSRYLLTERPKNGKKNVVLDSFLPRILYNSETVTQDILNTLPVSSYTLSGIASHYLRRPQIPFKDLCLILGYTKAKLTKLLQKVKSKDLHFVFVGAGGTGVNTGWWFKQLSEFTGVINLFRTISIYDNDTLEFSNLLRFPIDIDYYYTSTQNAPYKANLLKTIVSRLSKNRIRSHFSNLYYTHFNSNTILYGAPNIEDRNKLSKQSSPFICATHADLSCSIWLNPLQNTDIQVESYGLIQLNVFFMNQLKMAIATLELLASDQDLTEQDKHILDYSFNGISLDKPSKTYNWQIQQEQRVLTETEATF